MTEQDIINYLKNHPTFFANHLELLDTLIIPHAQKGNLSLIEMQLERQRQYIKELESELTKFGRLAQQEPDISRTYAVTTKVICYQPFFTGY